MKLRFITLICAAIVIIQLQACGGLGYVVDGVPLPANTSSKSGDEASTLAGTWVGRWGGTLKHILVVQSVSTDGNAKVVYAIGDEPRFNIQRTWYNLNGTVSGNALQIRGDGFSVRYQLTRHKKLLAVYQSGPVISTAVLTRHELTEIVKPGATPNWDTGLKTSVQTALLENDQPVRFEVVIYKPPGDGPFPLAVVNHGSTGRGNKPRRFTRTYSDAALAELLNERGWLVAFPQRRGRGKSDGLYDEGFAADRTLGYTCEPERSLAGAERGLEDIAAVVTALRQRTDVKDAPVFMSGQSRGGALAVAYAGRYPEQVGPVMNLVGGWLGDLCSSSASVNETLFEMGAASGKPMLWIYGEQDPFYSIEHSRQRFAAFQQAGGQGKFIAIKVPGGNGHRVMQAPSLWLNELDEYLKKVADTAN